MFFSAFHVTGASLELISLKSRQKDILLHGFDFMF